ncbi:MAG: DUF3060 domain-containing protein [Gordonia polyisoprenivorans]|nr:DUF3060 domain-containing protein [Gordonia polyisoprenivorans]
MRIHRTLAVTALALVASIGMTACSTGGTMPAPTKTSKPTIAKTVYNKCIDGAVQLWDEDVKSDDTITADDCAAANLISSDRTYELGAVGTVTVEATGSTISVRDTKKVTFTGNRNHLTYTGTAPQVDDHGTGNTVSAAG